jgi:hypothetical protein
MRVSRLAIVGLSGLVAMHIFMLAGHGHGHDPFAGMRGVTAHRSTATSPSLTTATDGDEGGTGMHLEMTVACLAVVARLLLLQPKQRRQTAPAERTSAVPPGTRPAPTQADLEGDHSRSSASR